MQTQELISRFADKAAQVGLDLSSPAAVERFREQRSGRFVTQTFRRKHEWKDVAEHARDFVREQLRSDGELREAQQTAFGHSNWDQIATQLAVQEANRVAREATSEREITPNLVTNQGLAHVLSIVLDAGTQITTWYLTMSSTNTAAAATMTAASPAFTEITTTDVAEAVRETWTGGSVTGTTTASIDNSASVATYTADQSFTAYAAALIGGGTSAFGNTSGTLYSYSLFASAKAMSATDTIDVTYTFTATDS